MQHHSARPHYRVTAEPRIPQLDSERLFVANETAFVERAMAGLHQRPKLLNLVSPLAGEPTLKQWQAYLEELEAYSAHIAAHQAEIEDGMIPVKFFVVNTSAVADSAIRIRVTVEHGEINQVKQPPARPVRIDGAQHVPDWAPAPARLPRPGGFSRSDITFEIDSVAARFSELEPHGSADLVNQLLYVEGNDRTRLRYEIVSKHLPDGVRGDVEIDA